MATPDPNKSRYDSWFQTSWRPAMAWQYLIVCVFDFMIAPIMLGIYSAYTGDYHSWDPLTIRGGGLYHLSMGAVVGVAVWSRGQEKLLLNNTDSVINTDEKCDPDRVNDRTN
jgi:hypothetical protein